MHSFGDWENVQKSATAGQVLTFASPTPTISESAIQSAVSHAPGSAKFIVIPCGTIGELLWKHCPLTIASLVAERLPHAAVVYRPAPTATGASPATQVSSVWEAIGNSPSVVHVGDAIESTDESDDLPEVAPRDRPVPKSLKNRILTQGDETPTGYAIRAGLLQIHDDLNASHEQAQAVEGEGPLQLADYWHAIMHRREPDYGNAKYWFRRVGSHPVQKSLAKAATDIFKECNFPEAHRWQGKLGQGTWDAMAFVDLCEQATRSGSGNLKHLAQELQWAEMTLLLKACCDQFKSQGKR